MPSKNRRLKALRFCSMPPSTPRRVVGLKMNVQKKDLDKRFWTLLPAEKSPTVSSLADSEYVAVEIIVEEKVERELIPQLKRAGASGIFTYPLNKVIH